ncbi:MAG: methyltransferase domain-containing protein [Deltaproteobacteria bacterium]|jgi:SAM-dependent methyltransferase|nr:methyltransferase domain-containing protein [Deltaproteobacteria bacterium]
MHPFYQSEWQNIPLASCAKLSCAALPDAAFYSAFYEVFFRKYRSFSDMPATWTAQKEIWAAKVVSCLPAFEAPNVLSVGCGIGRLESVMLEKRADIRLHCTEITDNSMRWIRPLLPEGRCHVGYVPDCLPPDLAFDLIYCGNIEYAMPDAAWLNLLRALRERLTAGGEILILSTSFLSESPKSVIGRARRCRQALRALGHRLGLKEAQFWGWLRTVEENTALCREAGLSSVRHGLLDDDPHCLWIRACSVNG